MRRLLVLLLLSAAAFAPVYAQQSGWVQTWSDEFDGSAINTASWNIEQSSTNGYGGTQQYWRPENVVVENGRLKLITKREAFSGKAYTSGAVTTKNKVTFAPDFLLQVSGKLPKGQGLWPAIWTREGSMPNPDNGIELDLMENLGRDPFVVYLNGHRWGGTTGHVSTASCAVSGTDFSAGFHTYAVEVLNGSVRWYIDGALRCGPVSNSAPILPSHLLLNTSVGGEWPGPADTSTPLPQTFEIEYVRVFSRGTAPPPPADTTAPAVSISSPAGGATVSGTVSMAATATDSVGVTGVQFTLDGANYGSQDTSAPYQVSWSTTGVSNGAHTLRAIARDAAGNTATSAAVTVTVNNAAPDTTAPTVSVTAPASAATVSGTQTVTATAADSVGVVGVRFTLDGANLGSEDMSAPYQTSWSTTGASNGSHALRAVARDAAGNTTTSAAVSVTVSNASPDTTAPTVSVTAPSSGATVSGTQTVTATASDSVGVTGVQFTLDGANYGGEDTSAPYQTSWSTTGVANGAHTLRAVARDAAGNTTTSAAITVTVDNGTSTPPVSGTVVPVAPPLPAPTGNVVNVSSVSALQAAVGALSSNQTIVIAPGTYNLTSTLWINGSFSNVTIRGASNNRDDVVLVGRGMGVSDASVPHGIWAGGNVTGLTIANLTIRDVYQHPILFNAGTESPRVYNVRLINAGQQFIKSSPDDAGGGVDNGLVEYSIFEYTNTSVDNYTNAIDVHTGRDWMIRYNLFRRIRAPQGQLAGPAILIWNSSSGTTVDSNVFIDCQREISLGLIERTPNDHTGGIIRNNLIVRSAGMGGDVAIGVFDSPGTKVVHNTVLLNGQYPNAIEYRFPNTTGVTIVNNLSDSGAQARDGAAGSLSGNVWTATTGLFVDPASGDLHLKSTATAAIDRGVSTGDAPVDWDNQTRPNGSLPDVGADEYSGTGTPPPPPADTTAPTVAVSAPTAGATVTGSVTVGATASDNVGVVGVRFTLDGAALGSEDTSAPYQTTWAASGAANGSHTLRAIARDAAGNSTTSNAVTVTVNNVVADTSAPSVGVTAPAAGATVSGTVTVTASASDNTGVTGVQFTLDGANLGAEDLTAPYQATWTSTGTSNGSHTLRALARDAAGNTTTSVAVTITVDNSDSSAPSVSMSAPSFGATVSGTVTVRATASDNVGVVGVQFTIDGVNLGPEVTTAPYQMAWLTTGAANGDRLLRAIARDAAGNRRTSSSRRVTVANTATATFPLSVTVIGSGTVNSAPAGLACSGTGSGCTATFNEGTSVQLSAAAATDWIFSGWAGECSGTGACFVTVNGAESVTASFQHVQTATSVPGDFNGDGQADLLWRHESGALGVWFMDGPQQTGGTYLNPNTVDPAWQVVALADFNGDGKSDVLWQHTNGQIYLWLMDGTNLLQAATPTPGQVPPVWRVVGTGDFNRDGKADIVWRQIETGALSVWHMNGSTLINSVDPTPSSVPINWALVSVADLNGDDKPDFVWHNQLTGALAVWFMNGTTQTGSAALNPEFVDPAWQVATIADFNHDGQPDILWRHSQTGAVGLWYMNGTEQVGGEYLTPSQVPISWTIVGGQ